MRVSQYVVFSVKQGVYNTEKFSVFVALGDKGQMACQFIGEALQL